MSRIAFLIERRDLDPAEVGVEADRPDNGRDRRQIDRLSRPIGLPRRLVAGFDRGINALLGNPRIDAVFNFCAVASAPSRLARRSSAVCSLPSAYASKRPCRRIPGAQTRVNQYRARRRARSHSDWFCAGPPRPADDPPPSGGSGPYLQASPPRRGHDKTRHPRRAADA